VDWRAGVSLLRNALEESKAFHAEDLVKTPNHLFHIENEHKDSLPEVDN
jgi:hypothetical protein